MAWISRGRHGFRYLRFNAQHCERREQLVQLLLIRLAVDPVQRHGLGVTQLACHSHIGQDHALLDQLVGLHSGLQRDRMDALVRVNVEGRLRRIEIQRAAGPARFDQHPVHIHQRHQPVHQRPELCARLRIAIQQRFLRLRIGQSRRRAHHGG